MRLSESGHVRRRIEDTVLVLDEQGLQGLFVRLADVLEEMAGGDGEQGHIEFVPALLEELPQLTGRKGLANEGGIQSSPGTDALRDALFDGRELVLRNRELRNAHPVLVFQ